MLDLSTELPQAQPAIVRPNYARKLDLSTRFHMEDGKMIVQRSQDCTAIAEWCKAQHNAGHVGSADIKHAARIPCVDIERYCNETGVSFAEVMGDPTHIKRIVKDPLNADFRIWKGEF